MRKIIFTFLISLIPFVLCNSQTTIKTPKNVSVEAWDNSEDSQYWLNIYETDAANWINDHSSDAVRIDAASNTYNCHGYAWHLSDGGDSFWIQKTDLSDNPNVTKYFSGDYPTFTSSNLEQATKFFYPDGDHSMIKCTTPGYTDKYVSKWGHWPLYRHSLSSHPYIGGSLECYKLAVSGDNIACISQQKTYSTLNISNATYDWDSNNFSISGSGYSITATAEINSPGSINVSIYSPYSGTTITGKTSVWAGVPILEVTGPSEGYTYNSYTFYANPTGPNSDASNYSWVLNPLYSNNVYNYGDYSDIAFYDEYENYQVLSRAQNTCGVGDYAVWNISISSGGEKFLLAPNPANDILNISVKDSNRNTQKTEFYEIQIIDFYGQLLFTATKSGSYFTIPISNLRNGNYIVRIKDGTEITNLKLIKK